MKERSGVGNIVFITYSEWLPICKQADDQKAVQIRMFPIYNYVVSESYERELTDLGIKSIWESKNPLNKIKK